MLISCTASLPGESSVLPDFTRYRDAGCEAVQLVYGHRPPGDVVTALQSAGLRISGVDVGCLETAMNSGMAVTVPDIGARMEWAKTVGSTGVCLGSGRRGSRSWTKLRDCLQSTFVIAERLGLGVHVLNARDTEIEQIEDLRRLTADVWHPRLRLAVDVGEFHASAVNARDVLAEFGDLIGCLRLSDRIGKRHVPLGKGEVNLQRIVGKAGECGYQGWFVLDTVEADGGVCDGASDALAGAVAYLKKLG